MSLPSIMKFGVGVIVPYLLLLFASILFSIILTSGMIQGLCGIGQLGVGMAIFSFNLAFALISFIIQCPIVLCRKFESREEALRYGMRTASVIFVVYILFIILFAFGK